MHKQPILIVDDSPVCLRILEQYLCDAGYRVVTADSGEEAWRLLQQKSPSYGMVMIDRLMMDMSGPALVKGIQSQPHLRGIPLVMLTSQAEPEEYVDAIANGVFDFLYKPIHPSLLLHVVKQALHPRAVSQQDGPEPIAQL